jgi:hypothetical protein
MKTMMKVISVDRITKTVLIQFDGDGGLERNFRIPSGVSGKFYKGKAFTSEILRQSHDVLKHNRRPEPPEGDFIELEALIGHDLDVTPEFDEVERVKNIGLTPVQKAKLRKR